MNYPLTDGSSSHRPSHGPGCNRGWILHERHFHDSVEPLKIAQCLLHRGIELLDRRGPLRFSRRIVEIRAFEGFGGRGEFGQRQCMPAELLMVFRSGFPGLQSSYPVALE
jgi:hypothetical protein